MNKKEKKELDKKLDKKMQKMFRWRYETGQQSVNSSTGVNETDSTEQGSDLGTLEKKRRESNRMFDQKIENAQANEMKQKYEMDRLRERDKELFKRVERLEKQVEKMRWQMAKYKDMEIHLNEEIDKKTKRMSKLRKKISKQGKDIKQIKNLFLSIAIGNGSIHEGTNFSKLVKVIEKKINKKISNLPDNK